MPVVYLTTNLLNQKKYIGVDKNNNDNYLGSGIAIKRAVKKHGRKNFKKEIIEYNEDIKYIYEKEKYWIEKYQAVKSNEFYNISDGGKGGDMLNNDISIEKHKMGIEKTIEITIKQRKGKTYEEIYGERANEEREKRELGGLGKKYDEDRCKNISNSLKGKEPWNKGLTIEDGRVIKIVDNHINREFLNIYELHDPNGIELTFNGKQKLEEHIKNINVSLKFKSRINVDNLIKYKFDKGYTVKIKK